MSRPAGSAIHLLAPLLLAIAAALGCGGPGTGPRPHIVLILSDDQAVQDLGAYGHDALRTPALDALAQQGMTFDRAFVVVPICTPSRGVLMTGRYGGGAGVAGFVGHSPPVTLVTLLRDAGYRTGLIGKQGHFPPAHYPFDYRKITITRAPEHIAGRVREFLAGDDGRPFFLMVAARDPHRPFPRRGEVDDPQSPHAVQVPPYLVDTPATRRELARYYDGIERLDRMVAAVRTALAEHGDERPMLTLFASDHGPSMPFAKATLYDAGIRVPMIAVWPGVVPAGARSAGLVSFVDVLATLLDAIGEARRTPAASPGQSFLPLLLGEPAGGRDAIFAGMDHVASGGLYPSRAVRTARFKYIENEQSELEYRSEPMAGRAWHEMVRVAASDPRVAERVAQLVRRPARELYDVESDPYELRNLAGSPAHEATRRALAERLRAWRRSIEDPRLDAASTQGARPSS